MIIHKLNRLLLAPDDNEGATTVMDAPSHVEDVPDSVANAELAKQSAELVAEAAVDPSNPDGPKVTTAEKIDPSTVDMDDFDSLKNQTEPKSVKKKEAPTPKNQEIADKELKEEADKEEEIKAPDLEEAKEEVKPEIEEEEEVIPKYEVNNPRDYKGLSKEEKVMFRSMSRVAYDKLRPMYDQHKILLKENTELKAKQRQPYNGIDTLPPTWLEHPEAVTLLPEFKQLEEGKQNLTFEKNFWTQQLTKLRKGEKANDLVVDDKGQYKLGRELEATSENEVAIGEKISLAQNYSMSVEKELQQFVGSFKGRHQQAVQTLKQAEAKFFPFFEKDLDKNPLKKDIDLAIKALPTVFQGHPMAPLLGKSYATITELSRQNKDLKSKLALLQSKQEDKMNAGPTKGQILAKGAAKTEDGEDVMDAFNQLKNRE